MNNMIQLSMMKIKNKIQKKKIEKKSKIKKNIEKLN